MKYNKSFSLTTIFTSIINIKLKIEKGRSRVLTHFSLYYRFLIILPVSELVLYREVRLHGLYRGRLGIR